MPKLNTKTRNMFERVEMPGKKGHRRWGNIKKQPTKKPSYQASFIGPDLRRHYAPHTFSDKMTAEAWLLNEMIYRDRCSGTNERWRSVKERENEKKATARLFVDYGATVLAQRKLKDSSRALYQDKWDKLIVPAFESVAIKDMSAEAVRGWFAGLGTEYPTRNSQAYTVMSMICATAVEDGLLLANPCNIKGATSVTPKPKGEPLTVPDVFAIAQWLYDYKPSNRKGYKPSTLEQNEYPYRQYKYLVLIAAFCGGTRIGEAVELRRKDIVLSRGVPAFLKVERGVTHRQGCKVSTTKAEDQRRIDIPEIIHADVLELLDTVPNDPQALLFGPIEARAGSANNYTIRKGSITTHCGHLNPHSFNANILKRAAREALGRTDISPHTLRHFATTVAIHAGVPMKENMARTGHRSKQVHIDYIDRSTNNGKEMAHRISDYAALELAKTAQ
ncbi:tyrosine-type recombinase/integrase [Mycolicibacterium porcinum]|uniref:tyrosine-type recombinase/integrase n=1 Tax=Mycolicibacterium porcinum TaxID=39693 RepID=UPI001041BFAE|nr:site-specific integrase [Mycolicibacterium porcinum]